MTEKPFWQSKKWLAAVTAAIAAPVAGWLGMPADQIGLMIGPVIAYVVGQGLADMGKGSKSE